MNNKTNYFDSYEHDTDLVLDKDSIFYGDLLIKGNLNIEGNLTVYGEIDLVDLFCSGNINCYDDIICNSIIIEGNLNCSGSLSAESTLVYKNAYIKEIKSENIEVAGILVYKELENKNSIVISNNKIIINSKSFEREKIEITKEEGRFSGSKDKKVINKKQKNIKNQNRSFIKSPSNTIANKKCKYPNCQEKVYLDGFCKEHYTYERADSK